MSEEGKNRDVTSNSNPQSQYQYGSFQGVTNYYPPFPLQRPRPFFDLPQPVPPPGSSNPYIHGYQTVTGYPAEEAAP